jgi:magnesium chelatase family protein
VQRYRARVSEPLLDRIDLHVEVSRLSFDEMNGAKGDAVRLCVSVLLQRVIFRCSAMAR